MTVKTAVVICPGRGVYNKAELGYLGRLHAGRKPMFDRFDAARVALGQETLDALDGAPSYSIARHTRGDNASALIYASTLADFQAIRPEATKVVAVTGNSMGWYSALACGGALTPDDGFTVVNTMGTLMQQHLIGGQLIYPFIGEDWRPDPARRAELLALVYTIGAQPGQVLTVSIELGGMLVLAGDEAGLAAFENAVPPLNGRFPLRLANHAGFHSHLQKPVSEAGRVRLSPALFRQPDVPMIDGRGVVWFPGASDLRALWDYTLGYQVTETYDFTRAITTAAREFAPDYFIITGPGTTLGGSVIQSLVLCDWFSMRCKADFDERQKAAPFLVSMGMPANRQRVAYRASLA